MSTPATNAIRTYIETLFKDESALVYITQTETKKGNPSMNIDILACDDHLDLYVEDIYDAEAIATMMIHILIFYKEHFPRVTAETARRMALLSFSVSSVSPSKLILTKPLSVAASM